MSTPVVLPSKVRGWKRTRYHLEAALCRALAWFIPKLSRRACVAVAHALGSLACRLDRRGRTVALANLECVFGERYTPAERTRLAEKSYHNFARTMLDLFWALRFAHEDPAPWISVEGFEAIVERLRAEKRGAIPMHLHHGNWEWANLYSPRKGWPLQSPAEDFKNPLLTALFQQMRQHTGSTVIPQENSLIRMLKTVKRGGLTGMLIDLNLRPTQAATVIEAFREKGPGLLMCVPLLHAVLAQRGGALLVPISSRLRPDGGQHIKLHDPVAHAPGAALQEITQSCWDALEPVIHERPEDWLWPYKHFRFRPKDAEREYPAYANPSAKFEKLRKAIAEEKAKASA